VYYVTQDWYDAHKATSMPNFHPYVPNAIPTIWYKWHEQKHKTENMWEMWFIYYMHINQLYAVYSNLCIYTGLHECSFVIQRFEKGLHFRRKEKADVSRLLRNWTDDYVAFPSEPARLDWNGSIIPSHVRY